MQFIKLTVILFKRKFNFHEVTNSRILAKIYFSRTFPNLQYNKGMNPEPLDSIPSRPTKTHEQINVGNT